MQRCEKDGLVWYEFELLADAPNLKHATLTRHGGVSQSPYDTLNISFDVNDDEERVKKNRERVCETLAFPHLQDAYQTHGTNVAPLRTTQEHLEGFDALATDQRNLALMVKHADCQAVILYDPQTPAIATIHAGWRGNVQNIYQHTVDFMKKHYESKPENLIACVSPSLGPQHAQFDNYKDELPEEFWPFKGDDNLFDLWAIAEQQLLKVGILPHHLEMARLCTFSTPEDFFSFRRERDTGRHGTIAMLVNDN